MAHHSLTRLFLLISLHCDRCTADWISEASDLCLNSLLALCRFALLFADGLTATGALHFELSSYVNVLQSFSTHVSLVTHGSSDLVQQLIDHLLGPVNTTCASAPRVWLPGRENVLWCVVHFRALGPDAKHIFVLQRRYVSRCQLSERGLSLTPLLDMDTTVALSILRDTSHHS